MPKLLIQNKKMMKTMQKRDVKLMNFGIPAGFEAGGTKTCPMMGACAKGCYAKQVPFIWTPVKKAYQWRFEQTRSEDFRSQLCEAIIEALPNDDQQLVIRIHDSGDFYSHKYLADWVDVMEQFPQVRFYTYTKMVRMFKRCVWALPENFTVIYSFGGLEDHVIDRERDRHSDVFRSDTELIQHGYTSAMEDDLIATEAMKVGLVYHGAKKKEWRTNG